MRSRRPIPRGAETVPPGAGAARVAGGLCAVALAACSPGAVDGVRAVYAPEAGFWGQPLPADERARGDGTVDLAGFGGADVPIVADLLALVDGRLTGASQTAPIWLPFDASLVGADLPTPEETLRPDAAVWLMDVDLASPERGRRFPVEVAAVDGVMPWDPAHALALLPFQGVPLRPGTRYAAVVTTALTDPAGDPLAPSAAVQERLRSGPWRDAGALFDALGVEVAAAAVFTTGDATSALPEHLATLRDAGGLEWVTAPTFLERQETHCVLEGRVRAPVLQAGAPPFLSEGGAFAADGAVQRWEEARVFVSLPAAAPVDALAAALFVRTGGGGDRPLLDRGVHTEPGVGDPGTGYAVELAAAGWAGVQVDGPLGGVRNPDGADEQFLIFNIANPAAMRDNLRQSALELALVPELFDAVALDARGCGGGWSERVAVDVRGLFGHSMGATIAPLAVALQPRFRLLVLSGAGGSWIHNILYKRSPLEVRPIAAAMLGQGPDALHRWHPVLGLLQWAGEAADPPPYAAALVEPPHVLMIQGIVDSYILPPIANAASVSLGLAPALPALDVEAMPEHLGVVAAAALVGRSVVALPVQGNLAGGRTGVVVQRAEDGLEDGHEVAYQDRAARAAVQRFFATGGAGVPEVDLR